MEQTMVLSGGVGLAGIRPYDSRSMFDPDDFTRTVQWEHARHEAEMDNRYICWLIDWQPESDAGSFGRWGW